MNRCFAFVPAVVLFCICATIGAQTPKVTAPTYKNNIGAAGGFVTGYGISYRRLLGGKNSLQITGIPFYYESKYNNKGIDTYSSTRDSGYSNFGNLSIGLTWLRVFAREFDIRLLSYAGANLNVRYEKSDYRERRREWISDRDDYDTLTKHVQKDDIVKRFTLGGGLGGEFQVWRLAGTLMAGIQAYYERETKSKGVIPSIEIGVYFGY